MLTNQNTLDTPVVQEILSKLHKDAKGEHLKFVVRMVPYLVQKVLGKKPSFTQQYFRMQDMAMPISATHGRIAYNVAKSISAKRIVEFGTAFGISTLYFASAVKDNGGGIVIGSEFIDAKARRAEKNIKQAGLSEFVEIRTGDAMQSLADPGGEVDLLLLDGSKDMYLPILKLITPHLKKGAVVLADNVSSPFIKRTLAGYVQFVQNPDNGFSSVTLPVPDGLEYSVKL